VGNAPGKKVANITISPFQGLRVAIRQTRGVAPGYYISPLRGLLDMNIMA